MEKDYSRYVTIAYIAFAILAAVVVQRVVQVGFQQFAIKDYALLGEEFPLSYAIGLAVAIIAFALTFRSPDVRPLADQVASELSKVVWPTRAETWSATLVVIVTVVITAVYLGVFDAVWLWASNALLKIPNGVTHG